MTEPPPVVAARPAASLLVLRQGAVPAVLMGMRGAGHRFMPNRLVFPGGAVDPEDHAAPTATPLNPDVLARLTRAASPELAAALGVAVARELQEETGLSLGNPPALDGLAYLCRAVTPENSPIRFDARFFVVDAVRVSGSLAGSGELEDLKWYDIETTIELAFATRNVMQRLRFWLEQTAEQRDSETTVATLFNRSWSEV